ncbi:MAG: protein phosphatase 2C domain-containing protein, partial [Gemmatimonadaceae bacterium]|nr:protein phosphatase 2C domain-containing protein [Gemmatimonadaceae bacterium]
MVRSGNEDNFFAEADGQRGVFVVADGMGGHAAGEVASEMAVQIVARTLLPLQSVKSDHAANLVAQALKDANRAIYERMLAEVDKQGMGT